MNTDDVSRTLAGVSQLSRVLKSVDFVGPLVERHCFSKRFVEIRSLVLDLIQLRKLEPSHKRDILIKDIVDYLEDIDEVSMTDKLLLAYNHNQISKEKIDVLLKQQGDYEKELVEYRNHDQELVAARKRISEYKQILGSVIQDLTKLNLNMSKSKWYQTTDPYTLSILLKEIISKISV